MFRHLWIAVLILCVIWAAPVFAGAVRTTDFQGSVTAMNGTELRTGVWVNEDAGYFQGSADVSPATVHKKGQVVNQFVEGALESYDSTVCTGANCATVPHTYDTIFTGKERLPDLGTFEGTRDMSLRPGQSAAETVHAKGNIITADKEGTIETYETKDNAGKAQIDGIFNGKDRLVDGAFQGTKDISRKADGSAVVHKKGKVTSSSLDGTFESYETKDITGKVQVDQIFTGKERFPSGTFEGQKDMTLRPDGSAVTHKKGTLFTDTFFGTVESYESKDIYGKIQIDEIMAGRERSADGSIFDGQKDASRKPDGTSTVHKKGTITSCEFQGTVELYENKQAAGTTTDEIKSGVWSIAPGHKYQGTVYFRITPTGVVTVTDQRKLIPG